MMTVAAWAVALVLIWLLFPVFAADDDRDTIRPLTLDELAAWKSFRAQDREKVRQLRAARRWQTELWSQVNYPAACWTLRGRSIGSQP